ncbi:MAG: alpha/beta hydrolase [Pseudopedobacter saltans]|uniref:Alpha/beta hydrolase n=1 Tax=Pseudopedobacter saltans TaxID=151895 RepID=A0A2W5EGP1_9SPHI|nr:MAG: alpha/beta hydrolase [Pseudopedobacter saltans]
MKYFFRCILMGFFSAVLGNVYAQEDKVKPIGINLEGYEYAYPVHYITLQIQGETLKEAYMDIQPTTPNGKSVLLLHGKNFNANYWKDVAKDLSNKGFRVIAVDQIGFGKSSKPAHIQFSFPLLANNTVAIMDSLGIQKFDVIGHSMGGMLATRLTLLYPERVEKLILEDPIGLEDWRKYEKYLPIEGWYQRELAQNYKSIRAYQEEFYFDHKWKPEYDEPVNIQAGTTLSIDYPRLAWVSAQLYDMIIQQPVCYEFGDIKVPTLLIIGLSDRTAVGSPLAYPEYKGKLGNYPELGKKTHALIKGSELVELPGIGHVPHMQDYQGFIKPTLMFLEK